MGSVRSRHSLKQNQEGTHIFFFPSKETLQKSKLLQFHWKKFEGTDSWFRFCYLDVKFIKPPCYNESGLALGQMSRFFQKHDAVFHASINVSLGRQRLPTGGLQAAESQAAGAGSVLPMASPGSRPAVPAAVTCLPELAAA